MTQIIQKDSPQYYEMGKKFLGAFVLVAAATASVGCQGLGTALHNIGQSSSQNLERGWYNITGSDTVCQRRVSSMGTRSAGSGDATRNDMGRVRQDCIEPRKMTAYELEKRKLELMRAQTQAEVMKTQAEAQGHIREAEMERRHEMNKRADCQNAERQAFQQNRELPADHVCYTKGYLSGAVNRSAVEKQATGQSQTLAPETKAQSTKKQPGGERSGWRKFADFMNASE